MDITVLNKNFEAIDVIDSYNSLIWTDRYDECGDFELSIPIGRSLPTSIQKGYYLTTPDSEHAMVIETINIESDPDEGARFIVKGRSLESILDRRIVWNKTIFVRTDAGVKPNLQNGVEKLLNNNIINTIVVRQIPGFIFRASTDEKVTVLTFEGEYWGEDLYTVIKKICVNEDLGFKLVLTDEKKLEFSLYMGADRSYAQSANPYVIFSPTFENLINSNYLDSDKPLKNVSLVVGETHYDEDGNVTSSITSEIGTATGFDRREIYTDSTSLSLDDGAGGTLSANRYRALLQQKGIDTLMENTSSTALEAEVNPNNMYIYGKDYKLGDIVQVADEYGHEVQARVSEFVISCNESGITTYPTFKTIQKGIYEV